MVQIGDFGDILVFSRNLALQMHDDVIYHAIINLYKDIQIQFVKSLLHFNVHISIFIHGFSKKHLKNAAKGFEVFINDHFVFDENDGQ